MDVPEWLEVIDPRLRGELAEAKDVLEEVAETWRLDSALQDSAEWVPEDEEDAHKVVRFSDAVQACFNMRNEILEQEAPEILAGIARNLQRTWDNMTGALSAWISLVGSRDLHPMIDYFRTVAVDNSPRGLVGRVDATRYAHEQALRGKALFQSVRRFQRRVSHRV